MMDARWAVGVFEKKENMELAFLESPPQVDIQIIDGMIRGH